jgi:hypothetical protein
LAQLCSFPLSAIFIPILPQIHQQIVEVKYADGKNVYRQNVKRKKAEWAIKLKGKKRRLGQKVEEKKDWWGQNVTAKRKKHRQEITLNGNNADCAKTSKGMKG